MAGRAQVQHPGSPGMGPDRSDGSMDVLVDADWRSQVNLRPEVLDA